jgi:hypothetical protein
MPIIIFLGRNVKEYEGKTEENVSTTKERIILLINDGIICCALCLESMELHSSYVRGIKETGIKIRIYIVWCSKCKKWHALLPDFLLPHKHDSGNEIEAVIIDSATESPNEIDTMASESTVRRWIKQIGDRIRGAVGQLKVVFGRAGQAVCEIAITPGACYDELEQILEMAPSPIKCSGNKLGMANIWLITSDLPTFI